MRKEKTLEITQQWNRPNWKLLANFRILCIWNVAAISLGIEPVLASVKLATEDPALKSSYNTIKKTLCLKMSVRPSLGSVTYYPAHEFNKKFETPTNRMVDVLSCIEVLETIHSNLLVSEFIALKKTLLNIPLPSEYDVSPDVAANSMGGVVKEVSGLKKDQKKAILSKEASQIAGAFYAVVCDAYGYDSDSELSKKKVIEDIQQALDKVGLKKGYGFSATKIKNALMEGLGQLDKKNR